MGGRVIAHALWALGKKRSKVDAESGVSIMTDESKPCVKPRVYLNIEIGDQPAERIEIEASIMPIIYKIIACYNYF